MGVGVADVIAPEKASCPMEINESGNSILAVELLPATRTNFREELSLNTLPPFLFPISCSPSGK